jgi:hypothetical protein
MHTLQHTGEVAIKPMNLYKSRKAILFISVSLLFFKDISEEFAEHACKQPKGVSPSIYSTAQSLSIRFKKALQVYNEVVQKFTCTCLQTCYEKQIKVASIKYAELKYSASSATKPSQKAEGYKNRDCKATITDEGVREGIVRAQIVLQKKEHVLEETVSYTRSIALADAYNTVGLFFGVCLLTTYGSLEEALVKFVNSSKRGIFYFFMNFNSCLQNFQ